MIRRRTSKNSEAGVGHLLCIVLLDKVEFQEGIFRRELTFQGVEENLFLINLRFALLQRIMNQLINPFFILICLLSLLSRPGLSLTHQ